MILYFSGTGNSRYSASLLAEMLQDELVSINDYMRSGMSDKFNSEKPFVFVSPTYCYRLPVAVEGFIRSSEFSGSKAAYFVMTCGAGTGGAREINRALCNECGLDYMGTFTLVMPDNYLLMYKPSPFDEADALIKKCRPKLLKLAETISLNAKLNEKHIPLSGVVSRAGSRLFNRVYVRPDKFSVTSKCISCGLCEKNCPLNNITITKSRPVWGAECMHCVACISACPVNAIEYGKSTVNRRRYYLYPDGTQKTP